MSGQSIFSLVEGLVSSTETLDYYAVPTLANFHASDAYFRGVRGPVGAGKTVGCCIEGVRRGIEQAPFKGVRSTRGAIIRNTYGELRSTTIKTWEDWFSDVTKITYGHPITGKVTFPLPDGTRVETELYFISMDKDKDVRKLKSLELTWAWLNEGSEIPYSALEMLTSRIGRYPSKRMGGATWSGIFADTNSPDVDNWWYGLEVERPEESYEFFVQPPALVCKEDPATGRRDYLPNPEAENIDNHSLGYNYYLRQIPGKPFEWVKVFILNQFGSSQPGSKVYGEYGLENHTNRELDAGLGEIIWTHDFNFTPLSSVLMQRVGSNIYAVDEIVLSSAVAEQAAKEFCERYKGFKGCLVKIYGDASGRAGEKHGHASDYVNIERFLKNNGWRVQNNAPRYNGSIKDSQNSLRAKIRDAEGTRSFFVNPGKCKTLDKGLQALKYKEGSTVQEEDADYQHITTAARYYTSVEFPIEQSFARFGP